MPPPSKQRTSSSSQRRGKSVEELEGEAETDSGSSQAPVKRKSKTSETQEVQQTIDKHIRPLEQVESKALDRIMKDFSDKLNKVASQEYLESEFKKMITADFLSTKLKDLEREVKSQIKKEIETVHKQIGELKNKVNTVEQTVETLRNKVSDMETSVERVESRNIQIANENQRLKDQLNEREVKLKQQDSEINNLEQYTRRNSVRIYGLEDEDPKESPLATARKVINLAKNDLNVNISTADIDVAHRMGRFKPDANRPVICKFVSRFTKQEVIKARKQLKGSAKVIREDLTLKNAKLLETTSAHDLVKAVWSDEGRIIALLTNDKKYVVDWKPDINKLLS